MKGYLLAAVMIVAAGGISAAMAESPGSPPPHTDAPQADAQAGRKLFFRCVACHATSATARPMTGPHLEGIVGRPAAALSAFAYSDALRSQSFIWDEAKLDAFLESPQSEHPGMCLTFNGLPRPEDRAAMIAYLKQTGS